MHVDPERGESGVDDKLPPGRHPDEKSDRSNDEERRDSFGSRRQPMLGAEPREKREEESHRPVRAPDSQQKNENEQRCYSDSARDRDSVMPACLVGSEQKQL